VEFESLSPQERAERYRAKARDQIGLAEGADTPEIRASCLELAAMWMRLAEAAQRGGAERDRRPAADGVDRKASA
jgi:hypothetical protein